ncbi:MAG: XRE family transcriptional regulator [Peptostreptococcaceae bacterium]|nr:XRE family transcriptional regulator [Peptostreptococcaceae bacterium]
MDINIGKKIMDFRKGKSLTIKELALEAQITASLLSQIERGLANPSINTISKIAKALEVPIHAFFLNEKNTDDLVVRAHNRRSLKFPQGENFTYELLCPDFNGSIEFALMTLEGKTSSAASEEFFIHNGEEVVYILQGRVYLYLDNDVIILEEGDSVRIPAGMKHKWENPLDEEMKMIFAVNPPIF